MPYLVLHALISANKISGHDWLNGEADYQECPFSCCSHSELSQYVKTGSCYETV